MFHISAHFIFLGHLSYFYYLSLVKLEQTRTNNNIYARYKQKKKNMRAVRQAPS